MSQKNKKIISLVTMWVIFQVIAYLYGGKDAAASVALLTGIPIFFWVFALLLLED
jgi:hypothetical protein